MTSYTTIFFPDTVITIYHSLSDLQQHKCILYSSKVKSLIWIFAGPQPRSTSWQMGSYYFPDSKKESLVLPFLASRASFILLDIPVQHHLHMVLCCCLHSTFSFIRTSVITGAYSDKTSFRAPLIRMQPPWGAINYSAG